MRSGNINECLRNGLIVAVSLESEQLLVSGREGIEKRGYQAYTHCAASRGRLCTR